MSAIEEIKNRLDIVELAGAYTRLTKSGKNFKGVCPFHQEKHGSFFVFPDRQSWHCFGACSTGGDIFSLVMKKEGIEFAEALKMLAARAGVNLPAEGRHLQEKQKHERLYQVNEAAGDFFYQQLKDSTEATRARDYVKNRGLNAQSVADFRLGFSPAGREQLQNYLSGRGFALSEMLEAGLVVETENGRVDRFRNRLMFPINNHQGRTAGFGGRALGEVQPKYLNSPETPVFDKSGLLYGLDLARDSIRQQNQAVLVEGYMDVIISRQAGFENTIAAMGTSIGRRQMDMIKKLTTNLVLALDADEAGEKAMLRLVEYENEIENEIRVIIMPPGQDPDEVIRSSPEKWRQLLQSSQLFMDFIFSELARGLDLKGSAGKKLMADRLGPIIVNMNNFIRQAHYLQKLSRLVGIEERKLEAHIKKYKTGPEQGPRGPQPENQGQKNVFSSPREEYCLAILAQHPKLVAKAGELKSEYFQNSENARIYEYITGAGKARDAQDGLDAASRQYFENLSGRQVDPHEIERKLKECILLLKESYYRNLMSNQEAVLGSEELPQSEKDRLMQEGVEIGRQLKEIFSQKARGIERTRREKGPDDVK